MAAAVASMPWLRADARRALAVDALVEVARPSPSADAAARAAAIAALGRAALGGDRTALEVLVASVEDWHPQVRGAAVHALSEVVQRGDRKSVYARLQGVQSLAPAALAGDPGVVKVMVLALSDEQSSVREAAFVTLLKLAAEGDSAADRIVSAKLSALDALRPAAGRGEPRAVQVLLRCATDWHVAVRSAGLAAVAALAETAAAAVAADGAEAGGAALHAVVVAGATALRALAAAARQGDARAVAAVAACAIVVPGGQPREALRACAVDALAHVVLDGDSVGGGIVSARLKAVGALHKAAEYAVATGGFELSQRAISVLVRCTADWHVEVREAAVAAVAEVATRQVPAGDGLEPAAAAVVASAGAGAHWAAVAALVPLARKGNAKAIAALIAQDVGGPAS